MMAFLLNMSDQEAESKEFEYPPTGEYLTRITDIELKDVTKPGTNFGKPFWKMTLVVEEGTYQGQTIPTSVMLFDGALYSIKQLCEAVHPEYIDGNAINLPTVSNGAPSPDPWIGQLVRIKGTKFPAGTPRKKDGVIREYDEFQVRFKAPKKDNKTPGTSGLPIPS